MVRARRFNCLLKYSGNLMDLLVHYGFCRYGLCGHKRAFLTLRIWVKVLHTMYLNSLHCLDSLSQPHILSICEVPMLLFRLTPVFLIQDSNIFALFISIMMSDQDLRNATTESAPMCA